MEHIPILKIGNLLLVSIQVDLQDRLALALQDDLSERIVATGARGVLIDISALEIVDSFIGRMLSTTASMSRVLDAETVVVGMRPTVAITLVELGLYMPGVRTALTVEHGLALLGAEVDVAWVDEAGEAAAEANIVEPPGARGAERRTPPGDTIEAAAEASIVGRPGARGAEWRTPPGGTVEDAGIDDGIGADGVGAERDVVGDGEVVPVPSERAPAAGGDVSG